MRERIDGTVSVLEQMRGVGSSPSGEDLASMGTWAFICSKGRERVYGRLDPSDRPSFLPCERGNKVINSRVKRGGRCWQFAGRGEGVKGSSKIALPGLASL